MNNSNNFVLNNILDFDYKNKSSFDYKASNISQNLKTQDMINKALKYSFYQKGNNKLIINKNKELTDIDSLYTSIFENKDIEFDCNQQVFLKIYHLKYVQSINQRIIVMNLTHEVMSYKILLYYLDSLKEVKQHKTL